MKTSSWSAKMSSRNPSCNERVSYHVPSGYDYKEVFVQCGLTDYYGDARFCDDCLDIKKSAHEHNMDADNAWLRSAGWGEI